MRRPQSVQCALGPSFIPSPFPTISFRSACASASEARRASYPIAQLLQVRPTGSSSSASPHPRHVEHRRSVVSVSTLSPTGHLHGPRPPRKRKPGIRRTRTCHRSTRRRIGSARRTLVLASVLLQGTPAGPGSGILRRVGSRVIGRRHRQGRVESGRVGPHEVGAAAFSRSVPEDQDIDQQGTTSFAPARTAASHPCLAAFDRMCSSSPFTMPALRYGPKRASVGPSPTTSHHRTDVSAHVRMRGGVMPPPPSFSTPRWSTRGSSRRARGPRRRRAPRGPDRG